MKVNKLNKLRQSPATAPKFGVAKSVVILSSAKHKFSYKPINEYSGKKSSYPQGDGNSLSKLTIKTIT